jgi:hypothetical protein
MDRTQIFSAVQPLRLLPVVTELLRMIYEHSVGGFAAWLLHPVDSEILCKIFARLKSHSWMLGYVIARDSYTA